MDDDHSPQPITLDAKEKDDLLRKRAMEELRGERPIEPQLVFGIMQEDGTLKVLPVSAGIVNQAVVAQAKPLPGTQALAEMLEMGGCVLTEETEEPKRKGSDPNDRRTEWRTDERQVVWHPDGRITQSLLVAGNSTVVVECRNHEPHIILGDAVQGHTRLETRLRKRIEVNILPPDRRAVFETTVAAATDKKSAVGRLMMSTKAANEGSRDEFGALLQRLTGDYIPKDVDPAALTARAHCEVARDEFHRHSTSYIEKANRAIQNASKKKNGKAPTPPEVSITIGSDGVALFSAKADAEAKAVAGKSIGGPVSMSVRLDDYVAFLTALNKVFTEVNTDVRYEMGDRVLTIEFGTGSAAYRVFIPQANNGMRSDRCITDIAHQEWPKGAALRLSAEA
uniref:hypothetical protein n=1 Tax=Methylobacterium sp. B34 TaxID=95563 RepID=UPI000FE13BCD|nr:hypothetical protein [Methylobacterium sp. B34]